jgi:hypothetical protein
MEINLKFSLNLFISVIFSNPFIYLYILKSLIKFTIIQKLIYAQKWL